MSALMFGYCPSVSAGEWVTAEGYWIQDREFGFQFRAEILNSTAPTTREGIEKYLGSTPWPESMSRYFALCASQR